MSSFGYGRLAGLGLFALFAISFFVALPQGAVDASNTALLDAIGAEHKGDLVLLSEILAALKILGSIDIGASLVVGASVEVGQAMSVLVQLVEGALAAILAVDGLFSVWQLLLAFCTAAAPYALKAALFFGGAYLLCRGIAVLAPVTAILRVFVAISTTAFLLIWLAIPYAFNIAGWANEKVLLGVQGTNYTVVENLHAEVDAGGAQTSELGFWGREKNIRAAFTKGHLNMTHKLTTMRGYLKARVIHALCVGVFIPLGATLLLWLTGLAVYREVLNHTRQSTPQTLGSVRSAG